MKIWGPKPPGTLWATPDLLRDCITFTFIYPSSLHEFIKAENYNVNWSPFDHIAGRGSHEHLWSYTLELQYCAGGKIEKNEMGGACGAYGGGERGAQGSGGET